MNKRKVKEKMSKIKEVKFGNEEVKDVELEVKEVYQGDIDGDKRLIFVGCDDCLTICPDGSFGIWSNSYIKDKYSNLKKVTDRVRIIID